MLLCGGQVKMDIRQRFLVVFQTGSDSSVYWIAPQDASVRMSQIDQLKEVFDTYQIPWAVKFFGDLMSFKFRGLPRS